ncbi:hypothetical protein PAHAL_1G142900 [Panicum hallii]|uniref:Uncharacterized protein n=1 Tax=Panicum hallii TaxID=206008 RepID=A0A2S3GPP4_9POAL|nr:hypothetical protein PAHAL_1G142900 [Panicum hallii]
MLHFTCLFKRANKCSKFQVQDCKIVTRHEDKFIDSIFADGFCVENMDCRVKEFLSIW